MSDQEVIANLPNNVAPDGVTLTPEQATRVWASAKLNICGLLVAQLSFLSRNEPRHPSEDRLCILGEPLQTESIENPAI
jgi:hypothetical protein